MQLTNEMVTLLSVIIIAAVVLFIQRNSNEVRVKISEWVDIGFIKKETTPAKIPVEEIKTFLQQHNQDYRLAVLSGDARHLYRTVTVKGWQMMAGNIEKVYRSLIMGGYVDCYLEKLEVIHANQNGDYITVITDEIWQWRSKTGTIARQASRNDYLLIRSAEGLKVESNHISVPQ